MQLLSQLLFEMVPKVPQVRTKIDLQIYIKRKNCSQLSCYVIKIYFYYSFNKCFNTDIAQLINNDNKMSGGLGKIKTPNFCNELET